MWSIIVNKSLEQKRENRILEILQEEKKQDQYLNFINGKYNTTISLNFAKLYKTRSGAERLIKQIKSDNNSRTNFNSKFYWIKDYEFSIRRITKHEWDSIIDSKLNRLESDYNRKKINLIKEKDKYHFT